MCTKLAAEFSRRNALQKMRDMSQLLKIFELAVTSLHNGHTAVLIDSSDYRSSYDRRENP